MTNDAHPTHDHQGESAPELDELEASLAQVDPADAPDVADAIAERLSELLDDTATDSAPRSRPDTP